MADSTTSFWKSTALSLLLALVGVYVLYDWYDGTLQERLAHKETYIAQTVSWIKAGETRTLQPEDGQDAIRSAILTLEGRHRQAQAELKQQLDTLTATKTDLERQLAALKTESASDLAAVQQQLAQAQGSLERLNIARTELEAMYREAKAQAVDAKLSLDQLRQTIVDTTAEHQSRITELEHHLNERVTLARTTPLDSEMLRLAQAAGVLPPNEAVAADQQALTDQLAEVQLRLETVQTELDTARTDTLTAQNQRTELEQQLAQAQADAARAQTQTVEDVATAKTAAAEAQVQIFELQQQLADAQAALTQAQAQVTTASDELAENERQRLRQQAIFDEQAQQLAALRQEIAAVPQEREQVLQKHQDELQTLTATLEATQQKLAAVERDLQAAQAAASAAPAVETTAAVAAEPTAMTAQLAALTAERDQAVAAAQTVRTEAEQAVSKVRALYAGFAALGATYTPRGLLLRLKEDELRFPPGQARLPSGELPTVTQLATLLLEQPTLTARIEGHTDRSGSEDLNKTLSLQRAEAVKQALLARGVAAERVTTEGIGAARPIADNANPNGRSQNRRVEVYVAE
ncbi:OmpA family protein [Chromatium okenii]|uniref:OmpA family protein n=1 Tax=Chromatium okenii TaxID=61644 RepID=UPI0019072694|nr:OmpA family protein [Chromatium okenii]